MHYAILKGLTQVYKDTARGCTWLYQCDGVTVLVQSIYDIQMVYPPQIAT